MNPGVDLDRLDETFDDLAAWPDTQDLVGHDEDPRSEQDLQDSSRRTRRDERVAYAELYGQRTGYITVAPVEPPVA